MGMHLFRTMSDHNANAISARIKTKCCADEIVVCFPTRCHHCCAAPIRRVRRESRPSCNEIAGPDDYQSIGPVDVIVVANMNQVSCSVLRSRENVAMSLQIVNIQNKIISPIVEMELI